MNMGLSRKNRDQEYGGQEVAFLLGEAV